MFFLIPKILGGRYNGTNIQDIRLFFIRYVV